MPKILGKYDKIQYAKLDARMKESYNFQKASAILADFGFISNLLHYDWMGADFIAQHLDGDWLKIQLKSRLTTSPKYQDKKIHIMFENKRTGCWYLYPHDSLTGYYQAHYPALSATINGFSTGALATWQKEWLDDYKIPLPLA